jgi:hypothetical protein
MGPEQSRFRCRALAGGGVEAGGVSLQANRRLLCSAED